MLAAASRDRTIKLWEVSTRQELATLTGHTDEVEAVAFHPDGRRLVSGGRMGPSGSGVSPPGRISRS